MSKTVRRSSVLVRAQRGGSSGVESGAGRAEKAGSGATSAPKLAGWARRLGALYLLGCSSSQVDPDYAGEPLAVLRGALSAGPDAAASMPAAGMTVGLVWLVGSRDGSKSPLVAETAQVDGEFPFGFRLTIFSPPGPDAQSESCAPGSCAEVTHSPVYQGLVAALDEQTDLGDVSPLDLLGASLDYGVFYFERDAAPGEPLDEVARAAAHYNVPPVRGYHLYAVQKNEALFAAQRRCAANGLCVESKVAGGPAAQYWPDRGFEECLRLVPEAITCTSYPEICRPDGDGVTCATYFDTLGVAPTPAQLAEGARCDALYEEHLPPQECGALDSPWQHPGNPLGFEAEISIRLGAGLYEFMN